MPASRSLGDGLFELRFDVARSSWRLTYWFAPERRIVLLTVFRKQRQNERLEVQRARWALTKCVSEKHTAEKHTAEKHTAEKHTAEKHTAEESE
jgi:phage-related protein